MNKIFTTSVVDGVPDNNSDCLLQLDRDTCNEMIGRGEFGFSHTVQNHSLFTLEAIADLAESLPPAAVECHESKQPILFPGGCPDLSVQPSEIVRTIETNNRWMVLWNIEQLGEYRQLLDEILDAAEPLLPVREGGMGRREAFLFLSAPNAVTPAHFDPENNFLLQIRGEKAINVGRFPDRTWALRELDRYHDGGHRNLVDVPPCSNTFHLQPGDGVYLYPWAPHWVYNGPVASISLSITFRTRVSEQHELVHVFNSRLRRFRRSPRPAGESGTVDRAKAAYISFKGWLRRGGKAQRGARDYS